MLPEEGKWREYFGLENNQELVAEIGYLLEKNLLKWEDLTMEDPHNLSKARLEQIFDELGGVL